MSKPLRLALAAGPLLLAACTATPPSAAPMVRTAVPEPLQPAQESAEAWYRAGALRAASQGAAAQPARNLILFIGDGMSIPTVAAARILQGQNAGAAGEENLLAFERFPHTALSKTYNTNAQTPDSAGTMTAMASGVKTRIGLIGVDQSATLGDCSTEAAAKVPVLMELAEDAGLATGVISTARITHATPAATYAHTVERDWEADRDLPAAARAAGCQDIALQLLEFAHGDGIELLFGGGRAQFLPASASDPEYPAKKGLRSDGRDLLAEWRQRHPGGHWLWNSAQFAALDAQASGPLLGLFEPSHLQYELDRAQDGAGEPSLAELTAFAIRRLAGAAQGYVLVIEAGRIDHAHHAGNAQRALVDTLALSDAVAEADRLSGADTLIVVTADHSHTLTFAGYPARGNPILGLVAPAEGDAPLALDRDKRPYTTLGYANGPGYLGTGERPQLSAEQVAAPDYLQEAAVPLALETHGGDDVAIYARGPGAQAFRGVLEQNVIFHVLAQAQPQLRATLCARGACDAEGRPVKLLR